MIPAPAIRCPRAPPGGLADDSLPNKGPRRSGNGNFVLTEIVTRVERPGSEARPVAIRSARASREQTVAVDDNPYRRWSAASAIDHDAKGESAGWAIFRGAPGKQIPISIFSSSWKPNHAITSPMSVVTST